MAYIPAGSFEMGDHLDNMSSALPLHTVTLDGFYMDKTEVRVGQFKAFLADSDYSWGGNWDSVATDSPTDDHPMIYVNWNDAVAYAEWAGKRLPTEAEWEKAARGGLDGKRYPWGDQLDATKANYAENVGTTTVAGSYAANGYGLYDVAGNVREWCQDWYDSDYYDSSPATNPLGPGTGSYRVLRGGTCYYNTNLLRVAGRGNNSPSNTNNYYGFRCVSGLNFTSGPSAGGVFTSGEATPLLLSEGETGSNWFADLSLDPSDYTWSTIDSSSATLSVRLFVQPLGGIDASAWDFSTLSTVDTLADQLGSGGLNLVEGTDYQLLVVGQDDQGTTDDANDDLTEAISIQLSDLSAPTSSQPVSQITQVTVANLSSASVTITFVTDQPALASILYGTTTAVDQQLDETGTAKYLHSMVVSGLSTETDYYFKVAAGDLTDDNQGSCYHFTTCGSGVGVPYTTYGQVLLEDGTSPAQSVIVHLDVSSSDASSHPLSSLTGSDGYWNLNLGN
jgi:hypothetical protein